MDKEHNYLGIMYAAGYYDHSACERVYEIYETCYTSSRDKLTDYMASARVENSCEEYSIFVDGLLVYEYTEINKVSPYRILGGVHGGQGQEIAEEIARKATAIREKKKAEREERIKKEEEGRARNLETIERNKLAELLAKYGPGVQNA